MSYTEALPVTSERTHRLLIIARQRYPGETNRADLARRLLADTIATLAAVAAAYYNGDIDRAKAEIYGSSS